MSHLWVANSENTNLSADAVRLTRNTGNVNDYNTLSGVDNYLWSLNNNIVYSTYTQNARNLFTAYLSDPLLKRQLTYGTIDSDLMGITTNKMDKLVMDRILGVIYYIFDGKLISYDIDFGISQELTSN